MRFRIQLFDALDPDTPALCFERVLPAHGFLDRHIGLGAAMPLARINAVDIVVRTEPHRGESGALILADEPPQERRPPVDDIEVDAEILDRLLDTRRGAMMARTRLADLTIEREKLAKRSHFAEQRENIVRTPVGPDLPLGIGDWHVREYWSPGPSLIDILENGFTTSRIE